MQSLISTVSDDQRSVLLQYYGYSYSHLNRYSRVTSSRTCALTALWSPTGFMDWHTLALHGRTYFSHFQAKINPHLINTRKLLFQTIFVERDLCHVGKSSFIERGYLRAPDNKTVLCSSVMMSVHVDSITRKKKSLPDWFLQKYGDLNDPIRYPEFPDVTRKWFCTVKINASDTDSNHHANFSTYFTIVENAIYKFKKSLGNNDWMKDYSLEEISVNYLDDSKQGDELYVYVTPEPDSQSDFYVLIEKDGKVIVESQLKYCKVQSDSLWSKM